MSSVLVIAAHPDDEILGVGATVARHVSSGDSVYCVILGEGQTSRWTNRENANPEAVSLLHQDTLRAASIVGYKEVFFEQLPDNRFDSVDLLDVVKLIEKQINLLTPTIIYTHHFGDLNIDHQVTYKAVLTATRPKGSNSVREIYAFETLSSTEWNFQYSGNSFTPNVFIDVTSNFQQKIEAMREYTSELCESPHPRSLEILECSAKKWGSVAGIQYAEAFELIRHIVL